MGVHPCLHHILEAILERVLLGAQVIIDEAARRHITNQGRLWQLSMLGTPYNMVVMCSTSLDAELIKKIRSTIIRL